MHPTPCLLLLLVWPLAVREWGAGKVTGGGHERWQGYWPCSSRSGYKEVSYQFSSLTAYHIPHNCIMSTTHHTYHHLHYSTIFLQHYHSQQTLLIIYVLFLWEADYLSLSLSLSLSISFLTLRAFMTHPYFTLAASSSLGSPGRQIQVVNTGSYSPGRGVRCEVFIRSTKPGMGMEMGK